MFVSSDFSSSKTFSTWALPRTKTSTLLPGDFLRVSKGQGMESLSVVLDLCFGAERSLKANLGPESLPQAHETGGKSATIVCHILHSLQEQKLFLVVHYKKLLLFFLAGDLVLAACQSALKDQQTDKTKLFFLIMSLKWMNLFFLSNSRQRIQPKLDIYHCHLCSDT